MLTRNFRIIENPDLEFFQKWGFSKQSVLKYDLFMGKLLFHKKSFFHKHLKLETYIEHEWGIELYFAGFSMKWLKGETLYRAIEQSESELVHEHFKKKLNFKIKKAD